MGDIWDDAAAAKPAATATAPPPQQSDSSDSGDIWDRAAQRPIPPPLNLGPSKEVAPPQIGPASLADPSFLKSIPLGAAKNIIQSAQTVGKMLGPNVPGAVRGLPPTQITPEEADKPIFDKDVETPEGLGEAAGAGLEGIAEFVMGDMGISELTHGDKLLQAGRIAKALETSPRAAKAMELGMQAVRQGAVAGAQQFAHGASPADALSAAGVATVLGVPVGQISHWGPELYDAIKMAQENKYVKTPADMLVHSINPPEEVDLKQTPEEKEANIREYSKTDKELKSNLPYILGTTERSGIDPPGRRGFIDAIAQTADEFNDMYRNRLLKPVKDIEVSARQRIPGYQGKLDEESGLATLDNLDSRLNDINDLLFKYYERGKGGLPSEAALGAEPGLRKEAAGIRKVLYGEIQHRVGDALGVNVAETKARNGQLRDIADVAERRWQQARIKAGTPLGDVAPTPWRAAEAGMVRAKRALVGDPRDVETRTAWQLLKDRGDKSLPVGISGPSLPPQTNAFVEKNPTRINIGMKPTDIVWEGASPDEVQARKEAAAQKELKQTISRNPSALKEAAVKTPNVGAQELKKALASNAGGLGKLKTPPVGLELSTIPTKASSPAEVLANAPIRHVPDSSGLAKTVTAPPQAEELSHRPLPAGEPASMKQFERSTPGALSDKARAEAAVRKAKAEKAAKAKKLTGEEE